MNGQFPNKFANFPFIKISKIRGNNMIFGQNFVKFLTELTKIIDSIEFKFS